MNRAVTMRNVWRVAETYPIEGLWETQIVVNAEVVAVAKGHDRAQSKRRAAVICAGYEMRNALKTAKEFIENQQIPDAEWSRVLDVCVKALKLKL